jgi:hypothetical protein
VGGAQLFARVEASALASQLLAVDELRAGQLDAHAAAAQPLDRLPVEAICDLAVAHQRTRTRLDAEGIIHDVMCDALRRTNAASASIAQAVDYLRRALRTDA